MIINYTANPDGSGLDFQSKTFADFPMEGKTVVQVYDSLLALEQVQPHKCNSEQFEDDLRGKEQRGRLRGEWYGTDTQERLFEIIRNNRWQDGMQRMQEALDGFTMTMPPMPTLKRRRVRGDHGDSIDMSQVWAGHLDTAWTRCAKREVNDKQFVTICYPIVNSAASETDQMFWRGAAILKMADILTEAGYSVQIAGIHGTVYNGCTGYAVVFSKQAHQPLDVQSLIVPMAFSGYMRTAAFLAIMAHPFTVSSGLGNARYDPYKADAIKEAIGGRIIGGAYEAVTNKTTAREWIEAQIIALSE